MGGVKREAVETAAAATSSVSAGGAATFPRGEGLGGVKRDTVDTAAAATSSGAYAPPSPEGKAWEV